MHDHVAASVHIKRHLSDRERATIAAALAHFTRTLTIEEQIGELAPYAGDELPLAEDEALALGRELVSARKVKVCRSKTSPK